LTQTQQSSTSLRGVFLWNDASEWESGSCGCTVGAAELIYSSDFPTVGPLSNWQQPHFRCGWTRNGMKVFPIARTNFGWVLHFSTNTISPITHGIVLAVLSAID
jgi:hypothetical protein